MESSRVTPASAEMASPVPKTAPADQTVQGMHAGSETAGEAGLESGPETGTETGAGVIIDDALLDCLQLLCRRYHRPQSRENLTNGLPLVNRRLTPSLLPRAARRADLYARLVQRAPERIPVPLLPAILLLKNQGACLLEGWTEDGLAILRFPGTGDEAITLTAHELHSLCTGIAIYVRPRFRFDARAPEVEKARSKHWFWGAVLDMRKLYRDVLVLAFLTNLLAIAMPLFTMNVYDRVVPNQAFHTLWVLAIGAFLALVFDLILRNLRAHVMEVANRRLDTRLSASIMEHVLGLRLEARPPSVGAFAANVRSFEHLRDFIASATVSALIDLPFLFIFLFIVALIAWPLILPAIAGIALAIAFALWTRLRMEEFANNSQRASALRNATLVESLSALETIKTLNASGEVQRRWEHSSAFLAQINGRLRQLSASSMSITAFLQQLTSIAIVVAGVYLIANGELSMGGLIAAMMLASRGIAPVAQMAGLLTQYQSARAGLATMEQLMAMPVERPEDKTFLSHGAFRGEIELRNVSFNYPGREQSALSRVSLKIRAGERVAILGRIGSGKTTLQRLLLGLYQPSEGMVAVDGVDVRQLDPAELRRAIGYVPQELTLFYGSLRDNLMLGAPQVDDATLLRACELGGVSEFAFRHPQGFDLPVGERGDYLSAGQRQSVVIARASLLDPPILVLDEPSSHMDFQSEAQLKARLATYVQGKTLLLITHRTPLLDLVDRIIVMDHGQIVADGPKAEVLAALRDGRIKGAT